MKNFEICYSLNAVETIKADTYEEAEASLIKRLEEKGIDLEEFTFEPFEVEEHEIEDDSAGETLVEQSNYSAVVKMIPVEDGLSAADIAEILSHFSSEIQLVPIEAEANNTGMYGFIDIEQYEGREALVLELEKIADDWALEPSNRIVRKDGYSAKILCDFETII